MNEFVFDLSVVNRPDKGVELSKRYSVFNYLQSYKNICTRLQMDNLFFIYCNRT